MDAYIVSGYRTAVGKANRGGLRFTRPDEMAKAVIDRIMAEHPEISPKEIDDLIVGNAMPEAEQGLNIARLISLMTFNTDEVSGVTVNRYCASGLESLAIASAKLNSGLADCIIAGGTESMSMIPMGGWRVVPNAEVAIAHPDYYWGMGITAEQVAKEFNISREEQDAFSLKSHQKAIKALEEKKFEQQIVPIEVHEKYYDTASQSQKTKDYTVAVDEGPRADTSMEGLAKLRPVFTQGGTVTAGNSSQTSDGASFLMICNEAFLKRHHLKPIAQLKGYAAAGVPPRIMGIGPVAAVPKVMKQTGMKIADMDLIELNEAFASQSCAVIKELDLNPEIINVNGGAIALGHPLGCTGAKLTVQIINELKLRKQKYGLVTMCVGTGQGGAGIIEVLD